MYTEVPTQCISVSFLFTISTKSVCHRLVQFGSGSGSFMYQGHNCGISATFGGEVRLRTASRETCPEALQRSGGNIFVLQLVPVANGSCEK